MFDYVYQWLLRLIIFLNFSTFCISFHDIHSENISLQTIFKLRQTYQTKRLLRIIYFRESDVTVDENRLKKDLQNLTDPYDIDIKLNILDQSAGLLVNKLCTIISEEQRDTILIADLYTKEIDLISRSLQIPTIVTTNRYSIVQGKLVKFIRKKNSKIFLLLFLSCFSIILIYLN